MFKHDILAYSPKLTINTKKKSILMKNRDKYYLKALLLASISSIGMPVAQAGGLSNYIVRKEREADDTSTEMVSDALSNGILESHPSYGELLGHTSHSSHGSHGSHGSHTSSSHSSHVSSGYSGGGGGSGKNNSSTIALTALGGLAATLGILYLVKYIIKKHKQHVATRKADINRYHAFASRDLKSGMYGNDVDRMTDLLVENDVLDAWDRKVSHKWSHIKYNRKVKRSVKRMQARMGRQRTGKASSNFLMSLQQWKNTRSRLMTNVSRDSLDLTKNHDALLAVAILLVEKGYLKFYDADNIMSEREKSKILESYREFLRDNNFAETTLVDEHKLRLLNSLPNDNHLAETSLVDEQKMSILPPNE